MPGKISLRLELTSPDCNFFGAGTPDEKLSKAYVQFVAMCKAYKVRYLTAKSDL